MNRNDLLMGGVRPHNYCLPILKRREHQQRLQQAAYYRAVQSSFLARIQRHTYKPIKKQPVAAQDVIQHRWRLELYAEFFSQFDALDKLENFASVFGAAFYGFERNQETVTLVRDAMAIACYARHRGRSDRTVLRR